jgi:anti-sigma factor (TIGR02949 family)
VNCNRSSTILHGYLDNELDVLSAADFERHLEQCPKCVSALETLESIRSSLNVAQLYEKAPAELRKKMLARIDSPRSVTVFPKRTAVWQWLAVAAALILVTYIGLRVVSPHRADTDKYETVLAAEIIDAHLRSLQPGHLIDVVSTDQHTVKPWFDGKLDFSPPVQDFADQGFPLQGGRVDVVHGRSVAALVYGRRKHFINVFIWPNNEKDNAPRSGSQQGYQWTEWRKDGMEFCAVSDAAPSALEQLRSLLTGN